MGVGELPYTKTVRYETDELEHQMESALVRWIEYNYSRYSDTDHSRLSVEILSSLSD